MAITGATVIDGTESHPIRDAIIVIDGGRIRAVGARNQVTVPAGARIIDASDKFVLPGLWDMHAHFEQVEWGPIYLAAGVTTVRDVGTLAQRWIRPLMRGRDRERPRVALQMSADTITRNRRLTKVWLPKELCGNR